MASSTCFVEASDGTKLFVRRFDPFDGTVVAVLHICHGLGEHSGRYDETGQVLAAAGFVVYVHDHRAHGKTHEALGSKLSLGSSPEASSGGVFPFYVQDTCELMAAERSAHGQKPLFLWGHSMGSVIAQLVASSGKVQLEGLVLSGAPARLPTGPIRPIFNALLAGLRALHGEHGVSIVTKKLTFDKFSSRTAGKCGYKPKTEFDWLSRDEEKNREYIQDPFCGHDVSIGLWKSFLGDGLTSVRSKKVLAGMPNDLPVLVLHGGDDACGANDLGTLSYSQISKELSAAGKNPPKVFIYPRCRHELQNEVNRAEVMQDLLMWLKGVLAQLPSSQLQRDGMEGVGTEHEAIQLDHDRIEGVGKEHEVPSWVAI